LFDIFKGEDSPSKLSYFFQNKKKKKNTKTCRQSVLTSTAKPASVGTEPPAAIFNRCKNSPTTLETRVNKLMARMARMARRQMHGWETGASGRVETKKKKKRKTEKKN